MTARGGGGGARLGRGFYARDPATLARALLGQRLVRVTEDGARAAGTIVETEAYLGVGDRAAHSFGGRRSSRNEAMYGPPGLAYVYFIYGTHWCFNAVAGREGEPVAVLVRALEPVEGLGPMRSRRAVALGREPDDRLLCSGPARLCQALSIDAALNGVDLTLDSRLFVEAGPAVADAAVRTGPRIGVDYAGEWASKPLRFWVDGNPHVSVRPRTGRQGAAKRRG